MASANIVMDWQNLPDNIMTNIFHWALYNEPVLIPPLFVTRRHELMLVCRAWTQLIESSPTLWNDALFLPVTAEDHNALLQLANRWISRTSSVPVSIKLDGNFPVANRGKEATHAEQIMFGGGRFCPIQHIILPCASRIKSLMGTISTNKAIRAFLNISAGAFSNLQHLDLVLVNEFDNLASGFEKAELDTFHVFKRCKALRHITLHLVNELHPLQLGISWKRLTTIDLATRPITPSLFRTILRRSKSLCQGCFFVQFTGKNDNVTCLKLPKRVQTPTLQKLVLCVMHPSIAPHMLEKIKMPALLDLRIELLDPEVGWVLHYYLPILKAAKMLKALTLAPHRPRIRFVGGVDERSLRHRYMTDTEILEFFSAVPNLQELHLPLAISLSIQILDEMADGKHLSQLRGLEIGAKRGYAFCILSMVQRRNQLLTDPRAVSNRSAETSTSVLTSLQRITAPSAQISSLSIFVENEEKTAIEAEVLAIEHHRLCPGTNVRVGGREDRLFYHPK